MDVETFSSVMRIIGVIGASGIALALVACAVGLLVEVSVTADTPRADHECALYATALADGVRVCLCGLPASAHPRPEPAKRGCGCSPKDPRTGHSDSCKAWPEPAEREPGVGGYMSINGMSVPNIRQPPEPATGGWVGPLRPDEEGEVVIEPTEEHLAVAAAFLKKWRLDDSHGHLEALADLIAEREAVVDARLRQAEEP